MKDIPDKNQFEMMELPSPRKIRKSKEISLKNIRPEEMKKQSETSQKILDRK